MRVSKTGRVTIPKHVRTAAGLLPGSEVVFTLDGGIIVVHLKSDGVITDRSAALRAAAAVARQSQAPELRQLPADAIMAFLRDDLVPTPTSPGRDKA